MTAPIECPINPTCARPRVSSNSRSAHQAWDAERVGGHAAATAARQVRYQQAVVYGQGGQHVTPCIRLAAEAMDQQDGRRRGRAHLVHEQVEETAAGQVNQAAERASAGQAVTELRNGFIVTTSCRRLKISARRPRAAESLAERPSRHATMSPSSDDSARRPV